MLVIFVHELGHFMVAKFLGCTVEEFSIGFGPKIYSKNANGITYVLRCIPLGGYCLISELGMKTHLSLSVRMLNIKKMLILLAGPTSNLVFAVILIFLSGNVHGLHVAETRNTYLLEHGVSENYLLRHINGNRVFSYGNIEHLLLPNELNILIFRRDLDAENIYVPLHVNGSYVYDVRFYDDIQSRLNATIHFVGDTLAVIHESFFDVFRRSDNAGSITINPYADFMEPNHMLTYQLVVFMVITGVLSFGLFYFNLVPIPGLDGNKLLMVTLPALRNKVNGKWLERFLILLSLVVCVIIIFL